MIAATQERSGYGKAPHAEEFDTGRCAAADRLSSASLSQSLQAHRSGRSGSSIDRRVSPPPEHDTPDWTRGLSSYHSYRPEAATPLADESILARGERTKGYEGETRNTQRGPSCRKGRECTKGYDTPTPNLPHIAYDFAFVKSNVINITFHPPPTPLPAHQIRTTRSQSVPTNIPTQT